MNRSSEYLAGNDFLFHTIEQTFTLIETKIFKNEINKNKICSF